jgi:hypothetical protein
MLTLKSRAGKSSLILANQAKWRAYGLWGHAKFQNTVSAPFSALVRQTVDFIRRALILFFLAIMYVLRPSTADGLPHGPPSVRRHPQGTARATTTHRPTPIRRCSGVAGHSEPLRISLDIPQETLTTRELRARFQSLVENVFSVLAETRLFALFLDDLHEADESYVSPLLVY